MNVPLRPAVLVAALSLLLVACSAGGGATSTPSEPPASAPSSASTAPDPSAGGDPGVGVPGEARLVEPRSGQQNVLSMKLERIEATADGTSVTIDAYWTSGVEPCYVLDQVLVKVGEDTIDVTVREGTSDPNAICVMMAVAKHTIVTVTDVPAGTYTVRDAEGGAPPVELTVG